MMKRTPIEICHYLLQSDKLHLQWRFKTMIQALCNADLIAFKLLVNATSINDMPCKVTLQNILSMCKSKHAFINLQLPVNAACSAFQLNIDNQYPILQAKTEQDWIQMQNDMQHLQTETEQDTIVCKTASEVIVDTEDLHATEEANEVEQVQKTEQSLYQKPAKSKRKRRAK